MTSKKQKLTPRKQSAKVSKHFDDILQQPIMMQTVKRREDQEVKKGNSEIIQ